VFVVKVRVSGWARILGGACRGV